MSKLHHNTCIVSIGQVLEVQVKRRLTIQGQAITWNRIITCWIHKSLNYLTLNKIIMHACWTMMMT